MDPYPNHVPESTVLKIDPIYEEIRPILSDLCIKPKDLHKIKKQVIILATLFPLWNELKGNIEFLRAANQKNGKVVHSADVSGVVAQQIDKARIRILVFLWKIFHLEDDDTDSFAVALRATGFINKLVEYLDKPWTCNMQAASNLADCLYRILCHGKKK